MTRPSRWNPVRHRLVVGGAIVLLFGLIVTADANPSRSFEPLTNASGLTGTAASACSLNPAQTRAALDAFDAMLPIVQHSRCANCHGGMNPFVDPSLGRHLGGAMIDSATGQPKPPSTCQDCHGELPGWDVPGGAMFFVGKSPKDLCVQFKQFAPTGADFVAHIEHEPGLPHFIKQSFAGDRALNTLGEVTYESQVGQPPTPDPPPGTHAQFVALAKNWVNAIGRGWSESPDCGCALTGSWSGTVKAHSVISGSTGVVNATSNATVVLEPFSLPVSSGRRVQNYRATGGVVRWDVLVTGRCRGQSGGTMPLDTVDINGDPMAELRLEDVGGGSLSYQPTTGSWPDRWGPLFNVSCNSSGTWVTMPITNPLPTWWHYEIGNPPVTTDPNRLKGSYRWSQGPAVSVLYTWDLQRIP